MPSGTLRVRACPHDHRADDTDPSPPTRTPHRREVTADPVGPQCLKDVSLHGPSNGSNEPRAAATGWHRTHWRVGSI